MAVVMFCTVVMPVTAPASWETALLLMCWFHKYPVEMTESKKKRAEHMNHYEKPKRAFAQTAFAPSNLLQQVHGEPPLAQKSSPLHRGPLLPWETSMTKDVCMI